MSLGHGLLRRTVPAAFLLLVSVALLAIVMASEDAEALVIDADTTYSNENLLWTEDVEVVSGAKLTLSTCDVTFRPPGSLPLYLRVLHGSLVIKDSDLRGEGAGFIVLSYGDSELRNVTASGLGSEANSSLAGRGLPLAAHGGFMFYGTNVDIFNLDISGAPATALYAEDCELDVFSLGVRNACSAYTGTDQCAAVAVTYMGVPATANQKLSAVINSSKIESSLNHGLLVAAAATGYDVSVSVVGTDISSSAASGLVVYEANSHGTFDVGGDTNEFHHNTGSGILWVRSSASGKEASLDISDSRLYSNLGSALRVVATGSSGVADLKLDECEITDTTGHGAYITATGCTQVLNVTLVDSLVSGCKATGLYFTTDMDGKNSAYHMKLVGTTIEDSGSYGIHTKVSQSYCTFNLTLTGSEVLRSATDGIRMEYSLTYFSYIEAPSVTSNLTVRKSLISDNRGYGIYDTRYLKSYYYWAQAKSTLHAAVNVLDSTIRNHTRSGVVVKPTTQLQYTTYTSEAFLRGSTFTNNSGHGYYEKVDSLTTTNGGSTHVGWHVDGCTFTDLTHSGVYIELRRADNTMVLFEVRDSHFEDLGYHGAVLIASSTTYVGNLVASLTDCTFEDLGGNAYYLSPGRPGTGGDDFTLDIQRVLADNTTGIYVSLDGYSSEDHYELTVKDVKVTRTRGDALYFTIHPYQAARMETVLQDIYTKDTNGTALTLSFTSDRGSSLWGEISGENITLLDQVGGMLLYEHTGTLEDLTIKGSTDYDLHKVDNRVPADETGILELHSAAMDRRLVDVTGAGSLWVFNALRVKVEWQNGMAALGAGVQVQDRSFQVVAVGHVDSEEGMDPVELLAYILEAEEFRSRSPFIVNITFLDLEQTGVCSLDEPATVRIVVHDRVAPSMVILEPDDGAAQRASYFELRGSAFDAHAGILEVRYRIDGGEWVSVGSESPFRTTVEDVEPGEHQLEVEVSDRAGNIGREVIDIEIDNQPPSLIVVSPEGDLLTRDPVLIVRGETEDGATISINGEEVESLHGLFIAEVQLEEGSNTVTVVSMDRLSNVATVRFIATLDTMEPFLDVKSHQDGDWVSRTAVTLTGIVEAGCTLTVQGKAVDVDDQNFTALVQLSPGDNLVTLEAVDPAGNVYTEELNIHVATEPPWINLESPVDGQSFSQREVRVLGTVQPGSIVTVNGRRVTIKLGLIDELLILPEGESTIIVEAEDPAGNVQSVGRVVYVDTLDPVLTLDPLPERTRDPTLTVTGTVESATLLFINDAPVTFDGNGSFSHNVTLTEGVNVIRLVARDGAGHEDRASVEVELDSKAPFLRLVLPGMEGDGNGSWVADTKKVTVQVVSEPGVSITLNGVYILVGEGGTASVDITLRGDGEPTPVSILAVDDLGNSYQVEYVITYEGKASTEATFDLLTILSAVIIVVLLVVMVITAVRYRALVKRTSRRRRGPRPPGSRPPNGRRPNGNGNGRRNGNGNGGGR